MLRKAWRLSWNERRLLLEAVAELLRAKCQLKCLAFRRLAPYLGTFGLESPSESDRIQSARAREVGWAIHVVAQRLHRICTCLVSAMAAQKMLARRQLPYTLYIGVSRAGDSLAAHAWLRCGSVCVTGEVVRPQFTAIASFGHTPRMRSPGWNDPSIPLGSHPPPPAA